MTHFRHWEGTAFLFQPLADVLAARGIEDVDSFLEPLSSNRLRNPFSLPSMEKAATSSTNRHCRWRTPTLSFT
jgi:hypothetical protein